MYSIQFNSILFIKRHNNTIVSRRFTEPRAWTPLVQAQKLPVSQEGTLSRTTAHKGELICLSGDRKGGWGGVVWQKGKGNNRCCTQPAFGRCTLIYIQTSGGKYMIQTRPV